MCFFFLNISQAFSNSGHGLLFNSSSYCPQPDLPFPIFLPPPCKPYDGRTSATWSQLLFLVGILGWVSTNETLGDSGNMAKPSRPLPRQNSGTLYYYPPTVPTYPFPALELTLFIPLPHPCPIIVSHAHPTPHTTFYY